MHTALPIHPTLIHPLTGEPLQALGFTMAGRIIWPQLGGDGTGDNAGDGDKGSDDTGDGDKTGDDKEPEIKGEFDPERAKRAIAAAREGEKKARDAAKVAADRTAAILKAAGLTADGKPDPDVQAKESDARAGAAEAKARTTAVQLAVYKAAGKAGVDADAVLDSRTFLSSVSDVDPDAADFGDKIDKALKAALKANSKLAASAGQGSGSGRQGADHTGGSGNPGRPSSIREAYQRQHGN